tara:strand:+ start:3738 stop:4553 length:816 start_codon:yes stop_codon:yes gene_type:complete
MKNILVVVDSIDNVKELLKKSLRLLPEQLNVLIFEAAVINKVQATLDSHKHESCNIVLLDVSSEKIKNKAEKVIEIASTSASDTIVINRQYVAGEKRNFSFEKNLLKGLHKTNLLICGDKRWQATMNVLGTLDIENNSAEQMKLNLAALERSVRITEKVNGQLHLMTVIAISRVNEELDIIEPTEMLMKKGKKIKAQLESFVSNNNATLKYTPHVTAGRPCNEIPSIAKKQKMDLVILGNVGRTGITGLIVGNTAEKILQRLSVDVFIIKK